MFDKTISSAKILIFKLVSAKVMLSCTTLNKTYFIIHFENEYIESGFSFRAFKTYLAQAVFDCAFETALCYLNDLSRSS